LNDAAGEVSASFLELQNVGEYNLVPLLDKDAH
jgi:hypothetical protein